MTDLIRYAVFGVFAYSLIVAGSSWLLRGRRLNPFGRTSKLLKHIAEPALDPIETWLLRRGGNPQNAERW
ncbi:MAG: hypothetical protein ACE5FJ_11900, partial [Gemmatimonadales bacterium]